MRPKMKTTNAEEHASSIIKQFVFTSDELSLNYKIKKFKLLSNKYKKHGDKIE